MGMIDEVGAVIGGAAGSLGVRWHDPSTGRFTTSDLTTQETNPYLYAGGNPCNFTDSTGGINAGRCAVGILGSSLGGGFAETAVGSSILGLGTIAGGFIGAFGAESYATAEFCFD